MSISRHHISLALWLAFAGTAQAASPDAGTVLKTIKPLPALPTHDAGVLPEAPVRPALKLDSNVKIDVKAIRITGAKTFTDAELQPLVSDAVGKALTLAELDAIAQRITRYYHDKGYLLARAYLPAQDIKDGVVEIAVLEGRLGKLHIENESALAEAKITPRLADIRENEAINGNTLERDLLLLNDLPGVEVKSTLKPGASVGTTDLDIRLGAESRYAGNVTLDNYGNRYTGDLRLGGSLTAGNLAGLGDTLALRGIVSEGMNYERLAWQAPVGYAGTQMGVAYADMHYKLGKDFSSINAHGTAGIASLYALHPFQRSRVANINGQINYDNKRLNDDVDATSTQNRKTVNVWTFGVSGDHVDGLGGGGLINWSLAYVAGDLKLDAASQAIDDAGHRTAGSYGKLTADVSRLQAVTKAITLYVNLQAQQASKNLDSSEKMGLGGPLAVRAYPQGEAPADDAWLASLELRYAFAPGWQASVFYDVAEGSLNHSPIVGDGNNKRHLAGAGLGLSYGTPGGFSFQLGAAWRDGQQPTSDVDRCPRVWTQLIKQF